MATIREISDRAGVSIATVSKVLNNKSGVKQETADRILQIADQLNYRPNLNARSLKLGDARTIGIITEDLTVFNTPEIVDGVASVCETLNYHYILSNLRFNKRYHDNPWDYPESNVLVRSAVNDLLSKQVAGIIYIGCHSHLVASLKAHAHIPFVCVYCTCEDQDVPCVGYDDRLAAYEATGTLLEHTSEHIGMITGPIHSVHTLRRANGFLQALHDHGVAYDSSLVRASDWDRDSGYRLGGELIRAGAKAIFAQNDLVGTGVIDWCNQNGIEVGRDIFLIGYDNREISSVCRPSLSTVALPLFQMGQSAGHTLLDMGDLDFTAEAPHTVFDPTQRVERLRQELADPEVALVAMDIILGPGVAPDPASCYVPLMRSRPDVIYVCAVCGGEGDPQGKDDIARMLREAGAVVADSNYESARLCAMICRQLGRRE